MNTGGMGTFSPCPFWNKKLEKQVLDKIMIPTIKALNKEGRTFKGCLYFGLMITKDGAKVIEYNCRFGDPETQVVLPLLETDLLTVMKAVTDERLSEIDVKFASSHACCVIMASEGYPSHYEKGFEINIPENISDKVFIAGASKKDGKLYTNGGRVLGVTEIDGTLSGAVEKAYADVQKISFANAYYRKDIGKRALSALEE